MGFDAPAVERCHSFPDRTMGATLTVVARTGDGDWCRPTSVGPAPSFCVRAWLIELTGTTRGYRVCVHAGATTAGQALTHPLRSVLLAEAPSPGATAALLQRAARGSPRVGRDETSRQSGACRGILRPPIGRLGRQELGCSGVTGTCARIRPVAGRHARGARSWPLGRRRTSTAPTATRANTTTIAAPASPRTCVALP
jgi:hypothetical protein